MMTRQSLSRAGLGLARRPDEAETADRVSEAPAARYCTSLKQRLGDGGSVQTRSTGLWYCRAWVEVSGRLGPGQPCGIAAVPGGVVEDWRHRVQVCGCGV